jgi:hypothetical protein
MEFQVAETVEELETQHATLKRRIAVLVEQGRDGESITSLIREAAELAGRIDSAKTERDRAERAELRRKQDQARAELPTVRDECLKQRDAFLMHYRAACVALGSYLRLKQRACELTGKTATAAFGPPPENMNALRALELADMPRESLNGLRPDLDSGWKMSFPVTPMHTNNFKTR